MVSYWVQGIVVPCSEPSVACDAKVTRCEYDVYAWSPGVKLRELKSFINPKGPCSQIDIHRPQSTQIGTTLRPKYIYLDTWTLIGQWYPSKS